jgi:hypothetical protein
MTNTPTLYVIELPYTPNFHGDRKKLPNVICKVQSKRTRESSHFMDDQHKVHYVYGYLKGNIQNQIQPYIQVDKVVFDDVEALINILEVTFSDPDNIGMASPEPE